MLSKRFVTVIGVYIIWLMEKTKPSSVCRLKNILGAEGKYNDVLFRRCSSTAKSDVIFFGGDLQNYRECMTNAKYSKWNLEYTIELLSNRFQESNIWVVKPCEIQENTYSIYKNFVSSGIYGIPSHTSGQKSWHHLHLLIKHSFFALQDCGNGGSLADSHLSNSPLAILGFSKGCVVLNQLVYDLKDDIDEEVKAFIDRVETMYWLDGGHAGTSNTWITDADVLSEVPKLGIKVETHVTPYQVKDKARPWIGREYELFISRLKEFGVKVYNHKHFSNSPRSLDNHFAILELL